MKRFHSYQCQYSLQSNKVIQYGIQIHVILILLQATLPAVLSELSISLSISDSVKFPWIYTHTHALKVKYETVNESVSSNGFCASMFTFGCTRATD